MRWVVLSLVCGIAAAQTATDPALDSLAKELLAAPDAASRERIVADHPAQLGPPLVAAIDSDGNTKYAQNQFDAARETYAAAACAMLVRMRPSKRYLIFGGSTTWRHKS